MPAEARARLSLDASQFDKELKRAGEQSEKSIGPAMKKVGGMIAAAFSIRAVAQFAQEAMRTADEVDNLSKRLGLGAEATQALKVTAEEAGLSMGEMQAIILKLQSGTARATEGNADLAASFASLGISIDDMNNLDTEGMLARVTEAMYQGRDSTEVMNAVVRIFGEDTGPKMRSILEQIGKDTLPGTIEKFKEMGLVIREETIDSLDSAEETYSRFIRRFKANNMEALADGINFISGIFERSMGDAAELSDHASAMLERQRKQQEQLEMQRDAAAAALREQREAELAQLERIASLEKQVRDIEAARIPDVERIRQLKADIAADEAALAALAGDTIGNYEQQLDLTISINKSQEELAKIQERMQKQHSDSIDQAIRKQDELNRARDEYTQSIWETLSTEEKVSHITEKIRFQQDLINSLKREGFDDTAMYYNALTKEVQLQKQLADIEQVRTEKLEQAAALTSTQLEEFVSMRDVLSQFTEQELNDFIGSLQTLAMKINGLPKVQGLEWMQQLRDFRLPTNITEGKAARLAEAIVSFVNTLNRGIAGQIPKMNWLKDLEAIGDLKLPSNFTEGKAAQTAAAIRALMDGLKGLAGVDLVTLQKSLDLINGMQQLGPGGVYRLEIAMPKGMENGVPVILPNGMDQHLASISRDLGTLAGLKGVIFA